MLGSQIGEGELSNPVITQTVAREPGLPGTYHLRACGCQELEPSKGQGPQGQPCSTAPAQPARPGPLLREDPCPRPPHPLPGRETPTCALPPQVPWQWAPGALCVCTGESPGSLCTQAREVRGAWILTGTSSCLAPKLTGARHALRSSRNFLPSCFCARLLPRARGWGGRPLPQPILVPSLPSSGTSKTAILTRCWEKRTHLSRIALDIVESLGSFP